MEALGDDYDSEAAKDAERLKLGRRKGSTNKKNVESRRKYACSVTQAGVASEYDNLPSVTYPEIALCGRSNCGKSSLLNALCGMAPDNGVASVSSRPGWTQNFQLFTCTLRDDPDPFMSLLDIPGYGPAHAPQVTFSWGTVRAHGLDSRTLLKSYEAVVGTADFLTTRSTLSSVVLTTTRMFMLV